MGGFLSSLTPEVWFAFAGALGIKLLELAELNKVEKVKRPDLKHWTYWVPFLIAPILGGGLAFAYVQSGTDLSPILAINIGISAPVTLRAMAQRPSEVPTITQPGA
jgi:hypothetical protein